MKIRIGTTPSISSAIRNVRSAAPQGVIPGRVARPTPPPTPHLPPVHFFAEATVKAGGEATLRSEALTNRTGRPVEIHEIRLAARISPQGTFSEVDLGAFIRVRIAVGDKPVTNGFVPLWLMGKTEQRSSQVAGGSEANSIYVLRLSRPWHISDKTPIDVQFQHTGAVRFDTRAQIGLAGRYAANKATTSFVPYVSAFVSRPFGYSEIGFDESSEADIVNRTGRIVNVERIIGRVGVARTTTGSNIAFLSDDTDQGPIRLVTVRILTSRNLPIIRDYSSVAAIFGYTRSIDCPHMIAPNDFYRVGVKKIANGALSTPFLTWSAQANVSIVGWREETI